MKVNENGTELEKFVADVEVEGALVDETNEPEDQNTNEQGKETPAVSPADNKPVDPEPSQEGANIPDATTEETQVPLNKNPRFQEVIEEKNYFKDQYEKTLGLVQSLQESIKPLADQARSQYGNEPAKGTPIPKFFSDVYGEDPEAYAAFLNVQREQAQQVLEEARRKDAEEREEQQRVQKEEEAYISHQFKEIEDKHGKRLEPGSAERNEFTKFFLENPIVSRTDATKYDLVKGYELFQQLHPRNDQATSQKKAIASQTINTGSSAPVKTGLTAEQKSKMSMAEIARYALRDKGLLN